METMDIFGVSGNHYLFEVYPIWTQFKSLPGIYMFLRPKLLSPSTCSLNQSVDIFDILYIGQTEDFNQRVYQQLKQHHRYQYVAQRGATHIGVLALPNCVEGKRKWVELDLINAYTPSGNVIGI